MSTIGEYDAYPYFQKALIYANSVVKGHKLACIQEVQACQRFLDDLKREDFPYHIDYEKGEQVCLFLEQLPHTKGKWAGAKQNLRLENWQVFIVVNIFGWVDDEGIRRFRDVYLRIPRKNGKSLLAALIGIYMLVLDGEHGAEIYSGATTERQAFEVFRPAKLICERTFDLCEEFGINTRAKQLICQHDGSKFEPMVGNPGDGSSPSCAIIDEYHEHDTDSMIETMQTGMGARQQPLMLRITTAGSNLSGPCFINETDYNQLLNKTYEDDSTFAVMYGIDPEDDWTTTDALIKANPNYDVSVSGTFLKAQQKEAIRSALKQNAFKRKHLNQWVGAHSAWLNMETWNNCSDPTLKIEDFRASNCIFSIDLASRIDITAFLQVFVKEINGRHHYFVFPTFYLPESTVYGSEGKKYEMWANSGNIIVTDGNEIDFNEIQAHVVGEMAKFPVSEVVYDPWRATQLAQNLISEGATAVEFRNTVANMSPAMYELEAAISSGRLHHNGDPVMTWMASNVVAKVDAKDNIFPRKQRGENKIDGMVALIMAVGRLMYSDLTGLDDFLTQSN